MAKAIKAAVTVFVVTLLVVTGAAFIFGGMASVTFAGFSSVLFGVEVMAIAAMSAVSTLVGGLLSRDVDGVSQNFGVKTATRTPTAPRPIIYGECRIGGTVTHIETAGTDNHKLRMVICLAGHEIESLEQLYINDLEVTTTSSGGFQYVTSSKYVNSDNDNNFGSGRLVRFKFKDGSQTTADSTITSNSVLNSNDKFISVAYVFIEMIFDSEAFGGGIPSFAFRVKGKKVYDPRDSNQDASDPSTWAYSDNPALHVRDYLQDTVYGLKATSDELNDTTNLGGFSACANTCDSQNVITTATTSSAVTNATTVPITANASNARIGPTQTVTGTGISGTVRVTQRRGNNIFLDTAVSINSGVTLSFGQPTYVSDGFSDMSATGEAVLTGLLSAMNGKLSYVNGKFVCFAGASVTPEMTITDDNLLSPLQIQTANGKGEAYNAVKALYVDANNKYVATDTPTYTDSTLLANDTPSGESSANYRKTLEIQLPFTTSTAMAQRIQKQILLHQRQEVALSCLVNIGFMQLQPFDHVYLTNERMGFTQKRFEVLGQKLETIDANDESGPVLATRLDLKEIDPAVYNFTQSDYVAIQDEGDEVDTGDRSVTAPTGLSLTQRSELDGPTVKADIEASWTNNGDDLIMGTEIAYKLSTDPNYEGHIIVGKGETKGLIPNVVLGKTYNVKVRHLAQTNVYSDYTSAVNIAVSDPTSISAPTSVSATGNKVGILLRWTNPSNSNLRAIKIYRKTNATNPTDDTNLVHTMAGEPGATSVMFQGQMDGLTAGTTYYFWLRAVNHAGTHSSFTSSVNASFSIYDNTDIGLSNVTNHAQVKSDLSNFSVESDLFEITSSELRGKNAIKNAEIVDADIIGTNKVFPAGQKPNKTVLSGNNLEVDGVSQGAVKNSGLELSLSGQSLSLTGGGGSAQSFNKGSVGLSDLDSLEAGTGTKLSGIESGATVGAKAGVNLKDSNNNALGDEDVRNSDLAIDFDSNTTFRIKKGNTVIDSQAFGKANVGLSDLNSLESGSGTKLSGIEANATVGAQLGTNLKDSGGSALGDEDVRNSDLVIAKSGQNVQIKKGTTLIDSVGLDKGTVGLSDLNSLESGTGTKLSGIESGATVGAKAGTNLKDSSNNSLSDADVRNSDLVIAKSGQNIQIKKGTTLIDSVGIDKGTVGLSDLNSLESGTGTKLSGIETGATVGAKAGTNLKDSSNNALSDADVKNDSLQIDTNGTDVRIKKGSTVINTTTLDKGNVGLSDLNSLESGTGTKLSGIATGATNNGSTIDSNGNIISNISLGATMTLGTNSDDKIVVGNITVDGGNGRILITD